MCALLNSRRIALPLMALAVATLSSPALVADQTEHDLFQRIQEQVLRYAFFTVFDDVNVELGNDGHVVLAGHVTRKYKADAIEKRVVALDAVTAVSNEIAVLPASRFDDQLRHHHRPRDLRELSLLELRRARESADPHRGGAW